MSAPPARMNPFPGLRPFSQEEDYLFFGREEQTIELLNRLGSNRFVAVVGSSGSGKSSLVRCGLLSELLGGRMLGAGAAWEIAVTHPGGNPLGLLTEALLDADLYDRHVEHARENLLATLSRSHFGLVEAVKQAGIGQETNFLLVVDQFEEIFRFHEAGQSQQEMANEFVSLLLEAVAQKDVPIYVVLTMRSDFIGECGQFEGLAEIVNRGEFLIPRLTREQYKRVIEGPIKVAGGQISPRLLQRLLNDLGQQADQLPCLQHALMRTWDVWAEKGDADALDLDDYQSVGRMSQALSLHADEIYSSLGSDRQRELCAGVFKALTVQESENRGIRRPQRLGRLCQILDVSEAELVPLVDSFRRPGVTFLMPSQEVVLNERTIIDISHESLMRVWTRLRHWVDEEAQAAGIYVRLAESSELHAKNKTGLYRDPELGIALAWQDVQHPNAAWAERYRPGFDAAMSFLAESEQASLAEQQAIEAARKRELEHARQLAEAQKERLEQEQRAGRNLRKLVAGLAVVAIIAAIACVVALVARHESGRLAELAANEAQNAKNNEQRAERSQKQAEIALTQVETQKSEIESSLTKAEQAERAARAAEETGRKLLYTTDMQLAPFVWKDNRSSAEQLRALLAKHAPEEQPGATSSRPADQRSDLRGFEWYYYKYLLENSAAVFTGHETTVIGTAFDAGGSFVTMDVDGQVRRWNIGSRQEDDANRRDALGGPGAEALALSLDGRLAGLISANKARVWDTVTGGLRFEVDSAKEHVRRLILSRDGGLLVVVDGKIRLFNTASGDLIASANANFDRIQSLALSADGRTLAVVGHGNLGGHWSTFLLDSAARRIIPAASLTGSNATLAASALSPDGEQLAVSYSLSGGVSVFDARFGRIVSQNGTAHGSSISALAYSEDGTRLASGDSEGTVKVWTDSQTWNSKSVAQQTLKGHSGTIFSLNFSNSGDRLASGSTDKTARVWDLQNAGAGIRPLALSGPRGPMARYSPDGRLIAVAEGGGLRLWDSATGQLVRRLTSDESEQDAIQSVAFSPGDERLIAAGHGRTGGKSYVTLWDIDSGEKLTQLTGAGDLPGVAPDENSAVVGALAFSPDGQHLVAGFGTRFLISPTGSPNPLKVWNVATRQVVRRLQGHSGFCLSLCFSSDGKHLASAARDGKVILWSTDSWRPLHTLENVDRGTAVDENYAGRVPVDDATFSPDGTILALASRSGTVQLWNVATGELLAVLQGHSSAVQAVAFAPDGRTLASGSSDQTVRLWNVETRRELMQLDPGGVELGGVLSLDFSPDGRRLLVAGINGTAFWTTVAVDAGETARAAAWLSRLSEADVDFQGRIRMFSESPWLSAALDSSDRQDARIAAARAAIEANRLASREAWPEAVAAYDRLQTTEFPAIEKWLRTPGLLRMSAALVRQQRSAEAVRILQARADRLGQDPTMATSVGFGFLLAGDSHPIRIREVIAGSPAARQNFVAGDLLLKVNGTDVANSTLAEVMRSVAGDSATRVRLTVQHPGQTVPEDIDLVRAKYFLNVEFARQFVGLCAEVDRRIAESPRDVGLFELRAELATIESDYSQQAKSAVAAIQILSEAPASEDAARLQRLYRQYGDAFYGLKNWKRAAEEYARAITDQTTDEELLAKNAQALAESVTVQSWSVLKPTRMTSEKGATLTLRNDNSILASGTDIPGDTYTLTADVDLDRIAAIRVEVIPDSSLPSRGPGRNASGNFQLSALRIFTAPVDDDHQSTRVPLDRAWASFDYKETDADVAGAIHESLNKVWHVWGQTGKTQVAVFAVGQQEQIPRGTGKLVAELRFKDIGQSVNLGRFRLSVSENPQALEIERMRYAAAGQRSPWARLVAFARISGNPNLVDDIVGRAPDLAGRIGDCFIQGPDGEKDWSRAVEIYNRAITPDSRDVDLLSKRARAYEALGDWASAKADWSRAARENADGARIHAEFARQAGAAGQSKLARDEFEQARILYEQALKADPENATVVAGLTQLLIDQAAAPDMLWRTLKPARKETEGGRPLAVADDGTIRVEAAPDQKPDTVLWGAGTSRIRAVRIETGPAETSTTEPGTFTEYRIIAAGNAGSRQEGLRGRFVRLDLPGDNHQFPRRPGDKELKSINLAELQVFQGDQNIALRKNARQSTTWYAAERAVDGNTMGNDNGNPYAHTSMESAPWFEVDLGSEQPVDRIVVWNRVEGDLHLRMNHFRVRVLDRSRKVVYEQVVDNAPNPSCEFVPGALSGAIQSTSTGGDPLLHVKLPLAGQPEAALRYRVSIASQLDDLSLEDPRQQALKAKDGPMRLAAAYILNGRNDEAAALLDEALRHAESFDVKESIVDLALLAEDVFLLLAKREPDDLHLQMALARKLSRRGKDLLAEGQAAQAEAELERALSIVTRLEAMYPEPKWGPLTPSRITSKSGTTLTLQKDGSILASGISPDQEAYTIVVPAAARKVTAVRLEALPHPGLPKGGAGRDPNGDFSLSNFEFSRRRPGSATLIKVPFVDAIDSYHRVLDSGVVYPSRLAIDDYPTAWDVWPKSNVRQWACFAFRAPCEVEEGSSFEIGLRTYGSAGSHPTMGCFRLSMTADDDALEAVALRRMGADRALVAAIIAAASSQDGMLERIAAKVADNGMFQTELARHYEERNDLQTAGAARDKARRAFEQKLKHAPGNSQVAADLGEVLLGGTTRWVSLTPVELSSAVGATLTKLSDDSILVSGNSGRNEVYTVTAKPGRAEIRAFRLEAIPDESLPTGASGRRKDGDFALSTFRIERSGRGTQRGFENVPLKRAVCDYAQPHSAIMNVLDDHNHTFWDVLPFGQQRHSAVFQPDQPVSIESEALLRFLLEFKEQDEWLTLGRFRLSVSDDPEALEKEERKFAALQIDDPWLRLALAYELGGRSDEAVPLFAIALQQTEAFDVRQSIIEIAAKSDEVFAALSQQLPDDPQLQLAWARRLSDRGRESLVRKDLTHAKLDLQKSYDILTRLRTERPDGQWSVLTPTEMKSTGGETFGVETDGSIFVSGPTSDHPVYTIRARSALPTVSGLLLEMIPDSRLPGGGAGRSENGNFHLAEVGASISGGQTIPITSVAAESQWFDNRVPEMMIDRNPQTWWDTYQVERKPHWAAFEFNAPVQPAGKDLTLRLDAGVTGWTKHGLGRFRISATNRPEAFRLARLRQKIEDSEVLKVRVALAAAVSPDDRSDAALQPLATAFAEAEGLHARKRIIEATSEFDGALAALIRRFPDDQQLQITRARRLFSRGKERLAGGNASEALAELRQALDLYQKFPLGRGPIIPAPVEMKADSGAWLERLDDGSIFAHQNSASRNDNYALTFEVDSRAIKHMRLEVLADSRLPAGGPGWSKNGTFILSELKLHVAPADDPGHAREVALRNPEADFSQTILGNFDVRGVLNGNPSSGWGIYPEVNRNHTAVFELAEPLEIVARSRITVWLSQQFSVKDGNIGRFRISFSDTDFGTAWRLGLESSELAELQMALASAFARLNKPDAAVASLGKVLELVADEDRIADVIAAAATIDGALEKLSAGAAADPKYYASLARHYALAGNAPLAEAARRRARSAWEEMLKGPGNSEAAVELSRFLVPTFDVKAKLMVPTSEGAAVTWWYTMAAPAAEWMNTNFDDSSWTAGPGAFGDTSPNGVSIRTSWRSKEIWLRQTFEWQPDPAFESLLVRVLHDDGFEMFVNGRQIYSRQDYNGAYAFHVLGPDVLEAFQPGKNMLAVHCQSTVGAQLIDVGLHALTLDAGDVQQRLELAKVVDPWARLAASYEMTGDSESAKQLIERHPASGADLGDYFANCQKWEAAVVAWRQAVTHRPARLQAIFDKLMSLHRWNDAAEFGLPLALQNADDSLAWIRIGPVMALADDPAVYAEFCRRMAAQFIQSKRPEDSERAVKIALLRPGVADLAKLPVGFVQALDDGAVPDWFPSWAWGTRALLAFRSGDAKAAVSCAEKSQLLTTDERQNAFSLTILAMAQHQLREPEKSREAFEKAGQLVRDLQARPMDQDVLIARILFNEAEALINDAGDQ